MPSLTMNCRLLLTLRESTNRTPHMIPQMFYKRFAYFLAEPLTIIYARSYEESRVPDYFRESLITPIHKKGDKAQVSNYRPVAQGRIAAKVFEKLMAFHLQKYLKRNGLFDPAQYGFVTQKSSCTQFVMHTVLPTEYACMRVNLTPETDVYFTSGGRGQWVRCVVPRVVPT